MCSSGKNERHERPGHAVTTCRQFALVPKAEFIFGIQPESAVNWHIYLNLAFHDCHHSSNHFESASLRKLWAFRHASCVPVR